MISETTETGTKRCSKCKTTKLIAEFSRNRSKKARVNSDCLVCQRLRENAYNQRHPEKNRARVVAWRVANPVKKRAQTLRRYGITPAVWDAIFEAQGGRCIVTQSATSGWFKGWHTDHCHDGNFVRGILSHRANTAIGSLKDDPANFASAMIYLAVNGKRMTPEEWEQFCAVYTPLCIPEN